jgi:hypothetical protein
MAGHQEVSIGGLHYSQDWFRRRQALLAEWLTELIKLICGMHSQMLRLVSQASPLAQEDCTI